MSVITPGTSAYAAIGVKWPLKSAILYVSASAIEELTDQRLKVVLLHELLGHLFCAPLLPSNRDLDAHEIDLAEMVATNLALAVVELIDRSVEEALAAEVETPTNVININQEHAA